jgi:hypothetical protein
MVKFTESSPSFVPNTHKLYILRHLLLRLSCRKITLIHRHLYFELNNKLYNYSLIIIPPKRISNKQIAKKGISRFLGGKYQIYVGKMQ